MWAGELGVAIEEVSEAAGVEEGATGGVGIELAGGIVLAGGIDDPKEEPPTTGAGGRLAELVLVEMGALIGVPLTGCGGTPEEF